MKDGMLGQYLNCFNQDLVKCFIIPVRECKDFRQNYFISNRNISLHGKDGIMFHSVDG